MRLIATLLLLVSLSQALPTSSQRPLELPHHLFREMEYRVVKYERFNNSGSIPAVSDRANAPCEITLDPVAISTPNPLMNGTVAANFIIDGDGKVYSALVLTGSGNDNTDAETLKTIKMWRFRPATCNGVPTVSEAVILISQ